MIEQTNSRPAHPVGQSTHIPGLDRLPPANTSRWIASRKAEVVKAVEDGVMTIDDAIERYGLTLEEFCSWQRRMERDGVPGLRIKWLQKDRDTHNRGSQLSGAIH